MKKADQYEFFIPGCAAPAARMTRYSKFTNKAAQRYLAYKDVVGYAAKEVVTHALDMPLRVDLLFTRIRARKGDIDNLVKGTLDGMNKIAYKDDRQVKELFAKLVTCRETSEEGVLVKIRGLDGYDTLDEFEDEDDEIRHIEIDELNVDEQMPLIGKILVL